jgi:gp16 family phage-associated protein
MEENMDIEQRKAIINQKLESIGETIVSWSKKNKLDHRLVSDLINGKLFGTRGITLNARMKLEEFFGNIFDK